MTPLKQLLSRSSPYQGLSLIAFSSALIAPLTLEVIFNHSDLWFGYEINWQIGAAPLIWQVWTTWGLLLTIAWGTDRDFNGLNPQVHQHYSSILSVIGVLTYLLFGIPSWVWLSHMNLTTEFALAQALFLSACILITLSLLVVHIERRSNALNGLIVSLGLGGIILWLSWRWIN